MVKKPLVSVIIPTFNEERYIGECLNSLISQTYKSIEIIVVDDGSTDRTISIVSKFEVILIIQKHNGPAIARNLGASKAKGKILVFPDADIKYDKKYVEVLIKPIIEKKTIGTFNKEEYVANTENIWSNCWAINSDLAIDKRTIDILPDYLPLFRAISKYEFDKVGGYDNTGYTDDSTVSEKLGIKALGVVGARAYHFNPENLIEVFYSARWIGRGMQDKKNIYTFLRYSFINSLRNAFNKVVKGVVFQYIFFKLIYDFGIFIGVFFSFGAKNK